MYMLYGPILVKSLVKLVQNDKYDPQVRNVIIHTCDLAPDEAKLRIYFIITKSLCLTYKIWLNLTAYEHVWGYFMSRC